MKSPSVLISLVIVGLNALVTTVVFAQEAAAPAPSLESKSENSSKNQVQAAGTYADPKYWSEQTFPGAIHKSDTGYFESRFTGSAATGNKYFPPAGQDNNYWLWRGVHAGTYSDPKYWSDWSYPGAVHKSNDGYFESRFTGSAATGNKYFPAVGQDNSYWFWLGVHAGTYFDPKHWSDWSYPGAVHKGNDGYFESRFTGSAATGNKYFPPAGQDNSYWFWRGAHAGTFGDPKSWREITYIGAIHGAGNTIRVESKFNGVAGPTHYYPTNNQDNTWWKVRAIGCPVTTQAAEPSHFATKQRFTPGDQIDMAALVTKGSTKTSPLLQGLVLGHFSSWRQEKDSEVASAMLKNDKNYNVGSISVVLNNEGRFYALVESPTFRGVVRSNAKGEQFLIPEKPYDELAPDTVKLENSETNNETTVAPEADVDCNGTNIVDVLAGFSRAAVNKIGGPELTLDYARLAIEAANVGLRNSRIDTVRLRLLGIDIVEEDFPMTRESLSELSSLFGPAAQLIGADMIAGFSRGGGGFASLGGRYSLQGVDSPTAFRHEIGHNVGGNHCNTGGSNDYKFGYSNGTSSTFLCGNSAPYYSTPLISDSSGKPLGNATTADMARLWREQAAKMSSYQKAVSPVSGVIP
ncbi:hypothetical protein HX866_01155 [Pseudomonas gingeri]|uniref:hypothetical protein n=1 Tax=Pseudomonas gingeri TaxID=117681 RepID=UPI0015A163FA|nr:hypothetical protein [Pseudomonas gingeri]NWA23489.1 hypothetical protein [Pseudomonas gingeri]NWD78431.1 hypothetical protein [Pseudomonas gingeri]